MQAMKQKSQSHYQPVTDSDEEDDDGNREDVGDDDVDERWKKQRYTSNQLHKKLDAVSGIAAPRTVCQVLFLCSLHLTLWFTLPCNHLQTQFSLLLYQSLSSTPPVHPVIHVYCGGGFFLTCKDFGENV